MAELVMKELMEKAGPESQFYIKSTATSTEEIGNPVYPSVWRKMAKQGIDCTGKTACQLRNMDYDRCGLLIGMNRVDLRNVHHLCGGNYDDKMYLLMDFTDRPDDVADSWYTNNFETTW